MVPYECWKIAVWKVYTAKIPYGEIFYRANFRTTKFHTAKFPYGKIPLCESSLCQNFLRRNSWSRDWQLTGVGRRCSSVFFLLFYNWVSHFPKRISSHFRHWGCCCFFQFRLWFNEFIYRFVDKLHRKVVIFQQLFDSFIF